MYQNFRLTSKYMLNSSNISTALCILLYSGVSTYVGLYGSGLFNFGSYDNLPNFFAYVLGFNVHTSSSVFIENVFLLFLYDI